VGEDAFGGGGDVVAARGGDVAEQGQDADAGVLAAEVLQQAVDLVGGGDAAAGRVDVEQDAADRFVAGRRLEGAADLADGAALGAEDGRGQIGRASCRERV